MNAADGVQGLCDCERAILFDARTNCIFHSSMFAANFYCKFNFVFHFSLWIFSFRLFKCCCERTDHFNDNNTVIKLHFHITRIQIPAIFLLGSLSLDQSILYWILQSMLEAYPVLICSLAVIIIILNFHFVSANKFTHFVVAGHFNQSSEKNGRQNINIWVVAVVRSLRAERNEYLPSFSVSEL